MNYHAYAITVEGNPKIDEIPLKKTISYLSENNSSLEQDLYDEHSDLFIPLSEDFKDMHYLDKQ